MARAVHSRSQFITGFSLSTLSNIKSIGHERHTTGALITFQNKHPLVGVLRAGEPSYCSALGHKLLPSRQPSLRLPSPWYQLGLQDPQEQDLCTISDAPLTEGYEHCTYIGPPEDVVAAPLKLVIRAEA